MGGACLVDRLAAWRHGDRSGDHSGFAVQCVGTIAGAFADAGFWQTIAYSLLRITLGFFCGVMAGTVFAALSSRFHRIEELLAPLLLAIKSIPVASFIILALILFSSRNLAVPISFLIVLPIVYSNV